MVVGRRLEARHVDVDRVGVVGCRGRDASRDDGAEALVGGDLPDDVDRVGGHRTETVRGAYLTVPHGQIEAGRALGLHTLALHWTVTIPQLVRFALPGYANVWQVLVKSTAVVSVIGLQDLVGLANDAGKTVRQPFVFFAAVLLVYLLITGVSTGLLDRLERRHARGASHAR